MASHPGPRTRVTEAVSRRGGGGCAPEGSETKGLPGTSHLRPPGRKPGAPPYSSCLRRGVPPPVLTGSPAPTRSVCTAAAISPVPRGQHVSAGPSGPHTRLLSAFGPGSCWEHAPRLGLSRPCRVQRNAFGCGDRPPRDGCFCKETMFFTKGESSSWECGEASALTDPRTGVSISGTTLASPHGRDMAAAAPTVTCSPGGQESVRTSSHSELAKKTLGRGVAAFPTTANPKPVCRASAAAGRVRPPPRRRRGAAGTQGRLHGQRS